MQGDVNASWTSKAEEQFEYMYRLFFFVFERRISNPPLQVCRALSGG